MLSALPSGDAGTFATVDAMRTVALENATDPIVRRVAIRLTSGGEARDIPRQIAAIRAFLTRGVNFIDDPITAELVQDPAWLLTDAESNGVTYGDCDDVATLGAALGMAVGIPARFVLVSFAPGENYGHTWTELYDGAEWQELDTTRPAQSGVAIARRADIDLSTGARSETSMNGNRPGERPQQAGGGVGFAVVPVVLGGVSLYNKLGPLLGSSLAADRIRVIDEAFTMAIAGNEAALLLLRQRTGSYGVVAIPGMPGVYGGFATQSAKDYARQRYDEALRVLGAVTIPGTDILLPGVTSAGISATTIAIGAAVAFYMMNRKRRG
jgi:hypothetical protein